MYDVTTSPSLSKKPKIEVWLSNWKGNSNQNMTPQQAYALGEQLQRVAAAAVKEQERINQEAVNELNRDRKTL